MVLEAAIVIYLLIASLGLFKTLRLWPARKTARLGDTLFVSALWLFWFPLLVTVLAYRAGQYSVIARRVFAITDS